MGIYMEIPHTIPHEEGGAMHRFICLMRGINVGGKNMVAMKALKDVFEELGFVGVQTYINSGNILFQSGLSEPMALQADIRNALKTSLNLDVDLMIIGAEELAEALAHAPKWWGVSPESKHNAIFVIPPATSEEIISGVGEVKPEYEKVAWYGQIIFWSAPLATFSRTRWSQIVKSKYYGSITIRNANTAKKLRTMTESK